MRIEKYLVFKKLFNNFGVPMNRAMGIRLKSIDANETVLVMKRNRRNTNYGGTMHGGAILALAETVHGVTVLNKIGAFENLMVTRSCSLNFLKKAGGTLTVRFSLEEDDEAFIRSQLGENGKCEVELSSVVRDTSGHEVAALIARYHIKKIPKKGLLG